MNRLTVVWCEKPDEDDPRGAENSITFRVTDEWLAVDHDQLILPIVLLERDGEKLHEPQPSILKQYGGEQVLNSILLNDEDFEPGSEWTITRSSTRRTVEPAD